MLLCLVAVAVLPAYILLIYTALELHDRASQEALRDATQLSKNLGREQERVFREARELSQILASVPRLTDPSQNSFCGRFLADIHKTMPRYGNIGFATPDGNIYCSAVPSSRTINIADRAYFRRAIESGQFAVGEYLLGRITGKPSITVGLPLLETNGKIKGIIFAAIDLGWLREALIYADLPAESSVRVVDYEGVVLAHHPAGEPQGTRLTAPDLINAIRKLSEHTGTDFRPQPVSWMKTDRAYAVFPITNEVKHPAFVWTELSRTPVIAEIEQRFIRYLLWIAVATLLVAALAWSLSNRLVVGTIRNIADAARRFADGDLSARTGLKNAPTEIAGLAGTFDRMAEDVESRERHISEISEELARTNRILRTLSGSNRTLLRAEKEDILLNDMCRVATQVGGFRAAWVGYVKDDERRSVQLMAFAGLERSFFDALDVSWGDNAKGQGVCARAIRSGEIVTADRVLSEPGSAPWWALLQRHGIHSSIALPLTVNQRIIGMMGLYAEEQGAFTGKDIALLDELAADLSFGIETIRARAEHTRTENALQHLALHDPGSGLPNQLGLRQRLEQELQQARNERYPLSVFAINLPRLREIGDILGPRSVSQCIERIAGELRIAAGKDAFVSREGRFTIAVTRPRIDLPGAINLADQLDAAVRKPFDVGSCSMEVEAWIGIAAFPGHATDPDALVGRASLAAQRAQNTGRVVAVLEHNPEEAALKRLTMLGELRNAIDRNELMVHYQPKVDTLTHRIVGAEALVRWQHPVRGMVSPGDFIPLAEQTGLIRPITYQVLRMVTGQIHAWQQEHGLELPVAVNLSAHNLQDGELTRQIDGLIGTWGLERRLLELEITESTLMRDPAEAMGVLSGFSKSGMQLFIDDFGTGYSSLAYLASLPVHSVKIDRTFVNNMAKDAQHHAIVHSILSLADALKLKVVAEGVETREQADMLRELSCDELQGYLFSRPLPPEQFIEWALKNQLSQKS